MHVLITGGSGFIGQNLIASFAAKHDEITALVHHHAIKHSRCKSITSLNAIDRHEKFDVIINLAGAKINKRWGRAYQQTLIDSRVNTTVVVLGQLMHFFQAWKIFSSQSARDVSIISYLICLVLLIHWLGYGLLIKNRLLIIAEGLGLLGATLVMLGILLYG